MYNYKFDRKRLVSYLHYYVNLYTYLNNESSSIHIFNRKFFKHLNEFIFLVPVISDGCKVKTCFSEIISRKCIYELDNKELYLF